MKRLKLLTLVLICGMSNAAIAQEEEKPFARVELNGKEVSVGKPAHVVITLMVPTNFRIAPEFPDYDGLNAIVRSDGPDRMPVTAYRNGKKWTGASQTYWIYPMKPGAYEFAASEASGIYTDPIEGIAKSIAFAIDGFSISAVVPEGAEALEPLIVAENLTLEQTWDGPAGEIMKEGDAITRSITATIEGSSALFLPALIPNMTSDLARGYPQGSDVSDTGAGKSISGTRSESMTYVARNGGALHLPDVSVRWFNSATKEVEVATVSGLDMKIEAPEPPAEPPANKKQAAVLLGLLLLLLAVSRAYAKWLHPHVTETIETLQMRWVRSEPYAARNVYTAIRNRNLDDVLKSVGCWMRRQEVTDAASRRAFAEALAQVGRSKFGDGAEPDWPGLALAFRQMQQQAKSKEMSLELRALPEINPFQDHR